MTIRFIAALLVAATWHIWVVLKEAIDQSKGVWRAFRDYRNPKQTEPYDIQVARWRECKVCPIYYKPLRTCGSPFLRKDWPDGKPLGCFCSLEVKIPIKCNCFLAQETRGKLGWARRLNSWPEDYEIKEQTKP